MKSVTLQVYFLMYDSYMLLNKQYS